MAIFFKFKSAKDYDTVPIEGICISVANIRRKIAEKICMGRRECDFDLLIYDAQTNEEYNDEAFLVPKDSSVLVRRVPTKLCFLITSDGKEKSISAESISLPTPAVRVKRKMAAALDCVLPGPACLDTLGVDNIEGHEVLKIQHPMIPIISKDEDSKIKELVTTSAFEWQRHIQEGYSVIGKGFQNGGKGRSTNGGPSGRNVLKAVPHLGYICHRCGTTGHYIQHCPTNGDPAYDVKKVRIPKGIPRTMLAANPDGFYMLPTGETAVLTPNDATFDNEMFGLPSKSTSINVPPEYFCPLCREVMKEALISSKCCFKSYCDQCIRDQIISKARCACGAANILADHLLPNITLREAIDSLLESSAISSSRGSAGSKVHSQDMESVPASSTKTASLVALVSEESTLTSSDVPNAKFPIQSGNTIAKQQNVKDEVCVESLKRVIRAQDILKESVSQQGIMQSKRKFSIKSGNRLHQMVIHELPMAESDAIAAPSNRFWRDSVINGGKIISRNAYTTSPGLCYQESMIGLDSTSYQRVVPSTKSYEQNHVGNPQVGSVNDCGGDLGLQQDLLNMDLKRRCFHRY